VWSAYWIVLLDDTPLDARWPSNCIALNRVFAGLVAQVAGIWMGFRRFINMGVNLGCPQGPDLPLATEARPF
jgi:hypothetical protein